MKKTLVIVESPAKAKTIERYLNGEYTLRASVGHVRDLPQSTLGVNVNNDFKPTYLNMPGKDKVIKDLKEQSEIASEVLLATDPDREGEAIAWHLAHILSLDPADKCRISFNEITENAVREAVKEPRPVDMNLVNAQQTRRILDRLVGYELSPLLWKKVRKGLSAGRVQSVAVRIVVMREREIRDFKPEEYWLINGILMETQNNTKFAVRYHGERQANKVVKTKLTNMETVQEIVKNCNNQDFVVSKVRKGSKKRAPYAPFTTSTMQQDASRALGFSAKRTMRAAQQLYEGVNLGSQGQTSLVTYIRTDSVRVAKTATEAAAAYITQKFGAEYLPEKRAIYKNSSSAQDAHEAIRPSHFELPPHAVEAYLTRDQFKIYELIWNRFIASQMQAGRFATVSVDIDCGTHVFRTSGEILLFPGWLAVYGKTAAPLDKNSEDIFVENLPELKPQQKLALVKLSPEQKFTAPPARYTEASLIKELESLGIGRPSTYAPTLSTIMEREYVAKEGRSLMPTSLGETVTELLEKNFADIVDTKFTAKMEKELDGIGDGTQDYLTLLQNFYPKFHEEIEKANADIEKVFLAEEHTGRTCPRCGEGELLIKNGRYGKFLSCSRYPACDYTEPIIEKVGVSCPYCHSPVIARKSKRGKTFYVCDKSNDANCKFIDWNIPVEGEKCEVCGSYLVWKKFRGRTYKQCSNKECPSRKKTTAGKSSEEKLKAADVKADDVRDNANA